MNSDPPGKLRAIAIYAAAAAGSFPILAWVMQLWRANLRIPFAYGSSDELTVAMAAKWLIENPWILYNPRLGMPFGSTMHDWPAPDTFFYCVFKLLGLTTSQFGVVMNLFFLATFPVTLVCTLWVLRELRIGYPAALLGSYLFTFLPYHFLRGEAHMFLAAYHMVPLIGWLALRLLTAERWLFEQAAGARFRLRLRGRAMIGPLVICAIVGCSGTYYAFFGCFLFAVAAGLACARERGFAPLVTGALLIATIVIALLLSVAPHLLYGRGNLSARQAADAETYGLKITQMLLPVSGHRLPALAQLKHRYSQGAPLVNENDAAALGGVGACGFLFLLGWIGFRAIGAGARWLADRDQLYLTGAGLLALASTLLGSIGGFGSLTATLVYAQIRSYNRISVFIAFFALFAVALLLDRGVAARLRSRSSYAVYCGALAFLLLFGIWDQTTRLMIPSYAAVKASFRSDEGFVQSIEASVPPRTMIFQLPYLTYPYAARYDHAKGYLHSRRLRWSYGAMQDGRSDLWQRSLTGLPPAEMVHQAAAAGFGGVYLDREGYADRGVTFEREIGNTTGVKPLVSADNRLTFFAIPAGLATSAPLAASSPPADEIVAPGDIRVRFGAGFYQQEREGQRVWNWSRAQSELVITSPREQSVWLRMLLFTGHQEPSALRITGSLVNEELHATSSGARFDRRLTVPQGESILRFSCDAPRVYAPTDSRTMIFRLEDFSLTPE